MTSKWTLWLININSWLNLNKNAKIVIKYKNRSDKVQIKEVKYRIFVILIRLSRIIQYQTWKNNMTIYKVMIKIYDKYNKILML